MKTIKRLFGYIRTKILVILALVLATAYFGVADYKAQAVGCAYCVQLTGGLCVGCADAGPGDSGNTVCWPIQELCQCVYLGDSCFVPPIDP